MSLRPIKRLIKAKPTLEGAGVHLRRHLVSATRLTSIPFCSWTISATTFLQIISLAFPGILTEGSRPSRMCWQEPSEHGIAWAIMAP